MRELREKRRMTAKQLAARMAQLGIKWDRSIVANLEIGRRSLVSVEELLALAYVLDVSPVHLLIPLGDEWYAVTPTQAVYSGRAREWIRGTHPLPSTDPRLYFAEVPTEEYVPPQPVSEEEQRQRREQRLARLRQLEEEGSGEITWTSPPEEDP